MAAPASQRWTASRWGRWTGCTSAPSGSGKSRAAPSKRSATPARLHVCIVVCILGSIYSQLIASSVLHVLTALLRSPTGRTFGKIARCQTIANRAVVPPWREISPLHELLQAVRQQLDAKKLRSVCGVAKVAADHQAIAARWHDIGAPCVPVVPYLQQFPAFVVRRLLEASKRLDVATGDVIASPGDRKSGVFVLLAGRVDLYSHMLSAARDVDLVRAQLECRDSPSKDIVVRALQHTAACTWAVLDWLAAWRHSSVEVSPRLSCLPVHVVQEESAWRDAGFSPGCEADTGQAAASWGARCASLWPGMAFNEDYALWLFRSGVTQPASAPLHSKHVFNCAAIALQVLLCARW